METTLDKPKTSTVSVKLSKSLRDGLDSLATYKKRTPHFLMKEAIEIYTKNELAEKAALDRSDKAIDRYERTGLHVTLEEVETWANAMVLNPNTPPLVCHR